MSLTKSEGLSNTLFCTGQCFYKVKKKQYEFTVLIPKGVGELNPIHHSFFNKKFQRIRNEDC